MPNGAHALIRTLVGAGIDDLLHEPGHVGDPLRRRAGFGAGNAGDPDPVRGRRDRGRRWIRADGGRARGDPPAPGTGLGNGLANLHNARRARVPVVNIVGDHATYHAQYDTPLQSDIETVARNVSTWVRTSRSDRGARPRRGRGDRRRHRTPRSGGDADRAR